MAHHSFRFVAASLTAAVLLTGCGAVADGRSAAPDRNPGVANPPVNQQPADSQQRSGPQVPGSAQKTGAANNAPQQNDTSERRTRPTYSPSPEAVNQNPYVNPAEDRLSTFATDVDTASWSRTRAVAKSGTRPSASEVRTEEFVNAFNQGYAPPAEGIDVRMDGTKVPWLENQRSSIMRVGVQSMVMDQSKRPNANLTFVIDISGSMSMDNRLGAVKASLNTLVGSLRPDDEVTIVVYSDRTRVALPATKVAHAGQIRGVIEDLRTEGSTNAEAGLKLGYEEAMKNRKDNELNRVILLSDGVANVGNTGPEAILETIGEASQKKVDLVTVGFGMDNYNDRLMEQLADKGNGFYAYVDSRREAERLFRENLTGTLVVAGRDAKIQVDFDPEQVESYRLLGYENRDVADSDFRNDKVDGGEIGSGHAVTALYEVKLKSDASAGRPFAKATLRYLPGAGEGEAVERTASLKPSELAGTPEQAKPHLQRDVVVASLSESLRGGPLGKARTPQEIARDAEAVQSRLNEPESQQLAEVAAKLAE